MTDDQALQRARDAYAAYGRRLRTARDVDEARALYEDAALEYPVPEDVAREQVSAGGVDAEWLSVPDSESERVVVVVHGGGFASGSIATHRALAANVARAASSRALVLGYRRAPEEPFPAALDDVLAACRWLLDQRVPPTGIVLLGDSAGGGLTLSAELAMREAGLPLPAATVLIGPWVDMTASGDSMVANAERDPVVRAEGLRAAAKRYLGDTDPHDPRVAPLMADLSGLGPILIQVGSHEALLDDGLRLAERARGAGVEVELQVWEGMMHSWHQYAALLPQARKAIADIGRFVRAATASP